MRAARAIADLGSGAGFPGPPLAVALPARGALVESAARKCAFIERAVAAAGIANAEVVAARAEEWRDGIGTRDLVTARALAPLAVLASTRRRCCARAARSSPGGAGATRTRRRDGAPRPRTRRAAPVESAPSQPFAGRRATAISTSFARSRRHRRASPAAPGMARKRPLGS